VLLLAGARVSEGRDLDVLLVHDGEHRPVLNAGIDSTDPSGNAALADRLRIQVRSDIEIGLVSIEKGITDGTSYEVELCRGEGLDQRAERLTRCERTQRLFNRGPA
jgi:hypothetical protein